MTKEKDKKPAQKNIHDGHRARLYQLALNAGVENLSDVQIVELLLTYVFPRGDVNPLAHRLLDEFGSLANILDSQPFELCRVNGINERSAIKICIVRELFFAYTTDRMGPKQVLKTMAEVVDVVESYLRFRTTENMLLLALSPSYVLTNVRRIDMGSVTQVSVNNLDLIGFISNAKPVFLVVAHCHPYGSAKPSLADKNSTNEILQMCQSCGVRLLGSFIVGEDGVFSMLDDEFSRTYHDVAQLKTVFQNL